MTQAPGAVRIPTVVDYERTLILAIELSNTSWVLAAHIPGLPGVKAKRSIKPTPEALMAAIDGYRVRAEKAGRNVNRVIAVYEAGWSGFWLVRWLAKYGIETQVNSALQRSGRSPGASSQIRWNRRRTLAAHAAGVAARRTPCVLDGSDSCGDR